jgi:pentatricopeptide repeat protein
MLNSLQILDMQCCKNLSNHKPFYGFISLKSINMVAWDIKNLEIISKLSSLIKLDIHSCYELEDLSEISKLNNLEILDLRSCNKLIDVSSLSRLNNLKNLELSYCENLSNINPISRLNELEFIGLNGCVSLRDLSAISNLNKLSFLDLMGCQKITLISNISKLPLLNKLRLDDTPNVRDFKQLMSLPQLRELSWIDEIACSEVLMSSSYNRLDILFINSNLNKWIQELLLSKDAVLFSSLLLNCISCIDFNTRKTHLAAVSIAMRKRGIESESSNDLDAYTWESWCNLVLDLNSVEVFDCFELVVNELNIPRETEVLLGPVIEAASKFILKYPSEKEKTVQWLNEQLNQLESYPQETRQIAPSAAVFFASLNNKEEVLYWLQKATDEKAPLWRERVILALINYYANVGEFTEARRLLDEMQIQDEKDKAIASIANAMAVEQPIDAGFLLDDIKQHTISTAAALNLLQQPAMLREPQGIYQLLLHLQSTPDELASTIEKLIEQDTEGKVAASLKQLFLSPQHSGPSAAVFLELCKHPSITEYVKPRALEKYKLQLQQRLEAEKASMVTYLITEMQQEDLIDDQEAQELTKQMQNT